MQPDFSVIVPLYNKAAFVRGAVQSALSQTFAPKEVIVVDDGSTDGGAEAVLGIRDARLRVVRQRNQGVSAARNTGIELATGRWIAFLDADDWMHPRLLSAYAQAHAAYPSVRMLGAGFLRIGESEHEVIASWPRLPDRFSFEFVEHLHTRWMRGETFATSSVAIEAECLRGLRPRFPVGESWGEDLDVWFRVAERTPLVLVKAPLAGYRWVGGSLSDTDPLHADLPPFLRRMQARLASGLVPPAKRKAVRGLLAQFLVSSARSSLARGERHQAVRLLMEARAAYASPRWLRTWLMLVTKKAWPAVPAGCA
ncbi:glycosyltransferase family 2 protein [Ramlibacter humi]|uniref:Glycosyltransferase family 2 protein n=1 Tax=Ramlibacter humi TaxID=2530451 RepID=A0A4Z0BML6_9BURK|nr:glycosyltransferase family A protein [Ramlibacter humi]TFZ00071.1 glycosyltransferase family 2 protein [Ramlibacter humi]